MKKKWFIAVLMSLLCFSLMPNAIALNESESNDTFQDASKISVNETVNATFSNKYHGNSLDYDYDWYVFSLKGAGKVQLLFERPAKGIMMVELYGVDTNSQLEMLYRDTFDVTVNAVNDYVSCKADELYLPQGTYYIKMYCNMNSLVTTTEYQLTAAFESMDLGTMELEPNNTFQQATDARANREIRGSFTNLYHGNSSDWDNDWYRLTINRSGTLKVMFSKSALVSAYMEIYMVDAAGSLQKQYQHTFQSTNMNVSNHTTETTAAMSVTSGNYYIKLHSSLNEQWDSDYSFQLLTNGVDEPSAWAQEQVSAAIAAGLVPDNLQQNYTGAVARGEVAEMFIRLLEQSSGKDIDVILAEKGVQINPAAFTDTRDENVLAANALGIINGVGNNRFDPNGTFTRAQIAVIINRTAEVLGAETVGYTHTFTDVAGHWCDTELGWPVHAGIINGLGNNRFDPNGVLTTEQSIVIAQRALDALSGA